MRLSRHSLNRPLRIQTSPLAGKWSRTRTPPANYALRATRRRRFRTQAACSPEELAEIKRSPQWKQAASLLDALDLETDLKDMALAQAFGWGTQKYWQKEKTNETPNPAQVKENIEYLKSVGFKDEDLKFLVSQFPEFLGIDCVSRLRPNIEYLQKSFFLKGSHRVKAVLRKPKVIGSVIDCAGDCQGQCTRCWSQF